MHVSNTNSKAADGTTRALTPSVELLEGEVAKTPKLVPIGTWGRPGVDPSPRVSRDAPFL